MTARKLLKFNDLKQRRICENHTRLKELINKQGFPPGFWTGPNTHVWWEDTVLEWLDACPTERPPRQQSYEAVLFVDPQRAAAEKVGAVITAAAAAKRSD